MKVTVKTLQQTVFHIDADPTETVGDIKTKIKDLHGHAVEAQKLIYAGRVLVDSKTVEECNIKEKDFLVLMISKPRTPLPGVAVEPADTPTTSAPPPAQPATAPMEVAPAPPAVSASDPSSTTIPTSAAQPAQTVLTGDASFVTGEALQTTINNMVEMGFPRDQVMRALRASFNNPDRAVEYLMTGIPEHLAEQPAQPRPPQPAAPAQPAQSVQPAAAPAPAPAGQSQNLFQLAQQQQQQGGNFGAGAGAGVGAGAGAGAGGISGADLAALRDSPQMAQLRELVSHNPALLQPFVQQLAANNPGLAQAIAQNPEMLLQLLGPDFEGEEGQQQVIQVTPEEQAAIERLEALGFPRQAVIEAYFACDKNEELAANYLFEGGFDNE